MPILHNIQITPTASGYYKIELGLIGDINDCSDLQNMLHKHIHMHEINTISVGTMSDSDAALYSLRAPYEQGATAVYKYFDKGLKQMADSCKPEIKKRKIISAINELEV